MELFRQILSRSAVLALPEVWETLQRAANATLAVTFLFLAVVLFYVRCRREMLFVQLCGLLSGFLLVSSALYWVAVVERWQALPSVSAGLRLSAALLAIAGCSSLLQALPQILSLPGVVRLNEELRNQIAERTRAEQQLREQAEHLAAATLAAQQGSQSKSEFLANMSHEIRTPLTAILGFTELLLESVESTEARSAVQTVQRNGEHLLEIINDILDLSKIEAGRLILERSRVSPVQVAEDVLSLMRVRADGKGLPLEAAYGTMLPETIETDSLRLRQILMNLVGNAIKFTEHGFVRLAVRMLPPRGERAVLQFEVEDTGIGISAEQAERLFRPFVQADSKTTRKYGGTGLGLAICRRLAEMLGGDVSFSSEPGRGTTFCLSIDAGPVAELSLLPPQPSSNERQRPERAAEAASLAGCRLLLAEDGPDNKRLISFVLQKAGAHVSVVDNGQDAVARALSTFPGWGRRYDEPKERFDVVLMDMQMPVMDGYQAARKLRDQGYGGPIIALTAHAMAHDRQRCLDAGCDDYTTKPINRQELLDLVAKYASQRYSQTAPTAAGQTSVASVVG